MSESIIKELEAQNLIDDKSSSHLQEVTMDPNFSISCNSPAIHGSPSQGRTMKDYEEMLSSLRKENFNLRLNVYFLEERLYSSSHTPASQDGLLKKNIELKVNLEGARRELDEKQELLCGAARALEMMETSAARKEAELLSQITSMQNEIHLLRESKFEDRRMTQDLNSESVMMGVDDSVALYAAAFNLDNLASKTEAPQKKNEPSCECHQLRALLTVERENVTSLRSVIATKDEQIGEQREQILELKNKEEKKELENNDVTDRKNAELKDDSVNHQLERLQQENLNAFQMIQGCLVRIKQMDRENKKIKNKLQQKDDVIAKLELETKLKNVCVLNDNSNISCQSDDKELNWVNSHLEQKINNLRESVYVKSNRDKSLTAPVDINNEDIDTKPNMDIQQMLINRLQEMAYFFDSLLSRRCVIDEEKRKKLENLLEQTIDLPIGLKLNPEATQYLEETLMDTTFGKPSLKLENLTAIFGHHASIGELESIKYKCLEETGTDIAFRNIHNCINQEGTSSDSTIGDKNEYKNNSLNLKSSCCEYNKLISRKCKSRSNKGNKNLLNATWHGYNGVNIDQSESECWSEPDRNVSLARMGGPLDNSAKEVISSEDEKCQCFQKQEYSSNKSFTKDVGMGKHFENMECELRTLMNVKLNLETLLKDANDKISTLEKNYEESESNLGTKQTEIDKLQKINAELNAIIGGNESTIQNLNKQIDHLSNELNKAENRVLNLEKTIAEEQVKFANAQNSHRAEIDDIKESADTRVKEMREKIELDWVSRVRYDSLRKELDQGALQASQATLDKAVATEQKLRSDAEAERYKNMLGEARLRISELETRNAEFQNRIVHLESWQVNGGRALSSPGHLSDSPGASSSDLGIEGDHMSLVELMESTSSNENYPGNLAAENMALREALDRKQRSIEHLLRQRPPKKQEHAMCQEIHKTLSLLKQVRENLNHK